MFIGHIKTPHLTPQPGGQKTEAQEHRQYKAAERNCLNAHTDNCSVVCEQSQEQQWNIHESYEWHL